MFSATVTSVMRLFTLAGTEDPDLTWGVSGSVLWSAAELNTAIICACLPMLRPPLQALFPRLFRSVSGSKRSGGQYGYAYRAGKYEPSSSNDNRSRFSKRFMHGPPDPNSVTLAMDPIGHRRSRLDQRAISEESSNDEPYFICCDDDSAGILKRTDVTVLYEADESNGNRGAKVLEGAGPESPDHIEALPSIERSMPGRAL